MSTEEIRIGHKKAFALSQPGHVHVLIDCDETGAMMRIPMTGAQYADWRERRRLNQDIFPELKADVRETLISGTTPAEWQAMFGKKPFTKEQLKTMCYEFEA